MERLKLNGPPGTGKTRLLIDICEREMERGRRPHEIIFCSFTRAAAREARNRAVDRFGGTAEDYPWFATEHSICYRLLYLNPGDVFDNKRLRDFGSRYSYDFSAEDNGKDPFDRRYDEGMLKSVADHYEFFVGFMNNTRLPFAAAYQKFMAGNEAPDGFSRSGLQTYIERREQYKQEHKLWSFDDMIAGCLERGFSPLDAKVLILDESQDCSPLLWDLIRVWGSQVESYYIAGDPLQTLYFWAGSSPDLFYDFPGEEHVLGHSYRLTPEVKAFAQKIIERTSLPFPEYSPSDRHGVVERAVFDAIDWGNTEECFLLARTRWLISLFTDYFLAKGVPFKSERCKNSPLDTTKGRAFYTLVKLHEGEKVSNQDLADVVKHTGSPYLKHGAKAKVKSLVDGVFGRRELEVMGFTPAFMKAIDRDFHDVLCRSIEAEEKAYLSKVLAWRGRRAFEDPPPITVTTIHGSKGREKPTVYLCPDLTRKVWDGYARDKIPESLVYYVGATRAVGKLVVLSPQQRYVFPLPRGGD